MNDLRLISFKPLFLLILGRIRSIFEAKAKDNFFVTLAEVELLVWLLINYSYCGYHSYHLMIIIEGAVKDQLGVPC
jgi:hypothetical protein